MNFEYNGGLGVSAGEVIGVLIQKVPFNLGPAKNTCEGMKKLAEAVNDHAGMDVILAEPYRFPCSLFTLIANRSWNVYARKNGLKPKDLYRKL